MDSRIKCVSLVEELKLSFLRKEFCVVYVFTLEIVMNELRKNWNFHFDLQLHPTDLSGTYLYCQMIGFIPRRAQIF